MAGMKPSNRWDELVQRLKLEKQRTKQIVAENIRGGEYPPFTHVFSDQEQSKMLESLLDPNASPAEREMAQAVIARRLQKASKKVGRISGS